MIRLDKYLADAGFGTRSEVKTMIRKGRVSVNGQTEKASERKIDKEQDCVLVDGRQAYASGICWYMLHKSAGVVSATQDRKERTVMDLLKGAPGKDLFPVGRLDKDTEGLLLITNDGNMAHRLLSPAGHVGKTYEVLLDRQVPESAVMAFAEGVEIGEKKPTLPAELFILPTGAFSVPADAVDEEENFGYARVTITEGKFHQVKRMFRAVGCTVLYLRRVQMGPLELDASLKPGEYRALTEEEVAALQAAMEERKNASGE